MTPVKSVNNISVHHRDRWSTLKSELYDRYTWPTKIAARLAVGDWIERIYNRRRRHSKIGMISPVEFENRHNQTAQAA
jgi:putative transposase